MKNSGFYRTFIGYLLMLSGLLIGVPANAQTGVGPYALNFDGKNDHVDLGNTIPNGMLTGGSFDNGDVDQSWTFEAYVKLKSIPSDSLETIFFLNPANAVTGTTNNNRLALLIDNDPNNPGSRFRYYQLVNQSPLNQEFVNFNKDITDGKWHHIALTYAYDDADYYLFFFPLDIAHIDIQLYVDGNLVGSFDENSLNTGVQIQASDYLTLGGDYDGGFVTNTFSGKMDETRFWGDVRTSGEINNTMGKTLIGNEAGLVGYYPFNQESGINVPDEASVTNGIGNGTLDNMAPSPSWFTSYTIFTWEGSVDNNWNNGDNWRFGGVPKPRDRVLIPKSPNTPSQVVNNSGTVEVLNIGKNSNPAIGNDVTVQDSLILNSTLDMKKSTLTVANGAVVKPEGGASNKYVKGKVKKIGDEAFTFPLGGNGRHARLSISAPTLATDAFTASYKANGYSNTSSFAASSNLNNVSNVEYWTLDRTNGNSNVDVTLYWENGPSSGIESLSSSDPVVAHWNPSTSEWENLGQTSSTGSASAGGSITVTGVSSFSPFTFGSTNGKKNPLPVELLHFHANSDEDQANLRWATASETNNKHFKVQKHEASQWVNIGTVPGNGTTTEEQTYYFEDPNLQAGQTYYYRLKQVDFDGSYEYSDIESVNLNRKENSELTLYPNPVKHKLNIEENAKLNDQDLRVVIYNSQGQAVYRDRLAFTSSNTPRHLSVEALKSGAYTLILQGSNKTYRKRFVKQ